jgi:drug/metabolite transporter (DMT)-like permease
MDFHLNSGDIYALMAAFCWSSGIILFELSGKVMDSLQMNLIKNFLGVIGFFIVILITGNLFISYTNYEYWLLIVSAILGVAVGDLFLLSSLKRLGSGLYAVAGTSYILFVFLFAFLMFKEIIPIQVYLGGSLVIFGIMIRSMTMPQNKCVPQLTRGIIYVLIAQGLTAYSVLLIRPVLERHTVVHIAMIRFGIGFLFNMGHLLLMHGLDFIKKTVIIGFTTPTMVAGAFMGTFLSVIFWLSGFKYTLAGRAAIYNQLSTVFITIMAALFLKESMNSRSWIAVVLAVAGAVLVSTA